MEKEGKSNGTDVVKEGGDDQREGEGVIKQSSTRWLDVLDCPNPNSTPHLQAMALLEGNCCSKGAKIEEGGEGPQEEECIVSKKHAIVIMGTDLLDCPVCSNPLSPPIFQCSLGHFICSVGTEKACAVCSRPISDSRPISHRCHAVERIVGSVLFPCSYHTHGCTGVIPYHQKAEHEKACPHVPCFCPVKGCCFTGMTTALVDHFTAQHKWPMMAFKYHELFNMPVKVGVHILHGSGQGEDKDNDNDLILLQVGSPDSPLHKVLLVRVQAHMQEYTIACSIGFSWFRGQYQAAKLEAVRSSSLSKGMPMCCFCYVPEVFRGGCSLSCSI
ncbi:E3 ubiquitin-protein ligase SINA-like 5 [Lolium rigidum]|uniref:E3 ubiquitin-protein ligase SINA-like 5 n=1 Tax=Lolium rigidum TaxID=89674 RepID=UPI001F5D3868|nr:E3 ubiquitin-protein ligase SINA-like 5 [Lolium rigidum]